MLEIHRQTFTTSRKVIVAILVNVIDFFSWRTVFNFNFFEVKTSYHYAVDASKILLINSILSSRVSIRVGSGRFCLGALWLCVVERSPRHYSTQTYIKPRSQGAADWKNKDETGVKRSLLVRQRERELAQLLRRLMPRSNGCIFSPNNECRSQSERRTSSVETHVHNLLMGTRHRTQSRTIWFGSLPKRCKQTSRLNLWLHLFTDTQTHM